jgi:hypothetical protein
MYYTNLTAIKPNPKFLPSKMPFFPRPRFVSFPGEKIKCSKTLPFVTPLSGKRIGQNGADFHIGTTSVHVHLSENILSKQLTTNLGGGTSQKFSLTHLCSNALMPEVPGHQYFEKNLLHCVL